MMEVVRATGKEHPEHNSERDVQNDDLTQKEAKGIGKENVESLRQKPLTHVHNLRRKMINAIEVCPQRKQNK